MPANNIDHAKAAVVTYDELPPNHPREVPILLKGILHALLALHEQNEPITIKPTTRAPRQTKESK